ncbi:MAG: tRNA 4-thiouridine(8) synthase ThiI, partial [Clostridia bacterium]|nr:tRNA 4-thiouridine(8) synthase ThiI [Clostridia bacterium]
KLEITDRSVAIGAYETSILPYEDCCTVFTPKHPTTNPKRENIEKSEKHLDIEPLIEEALAGVEKIVVYPE